MMPNLITRFFSFDDLTPDQGWDLLRWCRNRGADEFTLNGLYVGSLSEKSERFKEFFEKLEPHRLPDAARRRLSGQPLIRDVERWELTDATVTLLREAFPDGYLSYVVDHDLWLEDLTVYRHGDFLMGVFTLETGGVIRVTEGELEELRKAGFRDRESLEYVGF
jgi:hypothetical protein